MLRPLRVDALVLTGVSTGGVIASTVSATADEDPDRDLHAALLRGLFPQHARVVTSAEYLGGDADSSVAGGSG